MRLRSSSTIHCGGFAAVARGRARLLGAFCALAIAWLGGCTQVGSSRATDDAAVVAPAPTLVAATAPAPARPLEEIARLARFRDHPGARLRTAWLQQEVGDWTAATATLNGLLFGGAPIEPDVEAVARYLRGLCFDHAGDRPRAENDWRAAAAQARDPVLVARVGEMLRDTPAPSAPTEAGPAPMPDVLGRGEWRAASARVRSMRKMPTAHRITVHHSATLVSSTSKSAAIGAIRGIQRHHQVDNGWGDIGYHFLIDPAGRVWTGRALEWQGAHAGDTAKNEENIGICLLGNFVKSGQGPPSAPQLRALEGLVRSLCVRYRIPARNVLTHRELKDSTECPGPYLQVAVEQLRDRLEGALFAAGTPSQ